MPSPETPTTRYQWLVTYTHGVRRTNSLYTRAEAEQRWPGRCEPDPATRDDTGGNKYGAG